MAWLYPVVMVVLRSVKSETGKYPSVSPFGAVRLMGRLANFHARPSGDFPVSDFKDLRTTTVPAAGNKKEPKKPKKSK